MVEIDFSDIEEKYSITVPEGFNNVILIDNLPIVDSKKEEKLINVIKKIFKDITQEMSVFMPMKSDEKSKGFLFMKFETEEEAKKAILLGNGYKLDKSHILSIIPFSDVEKYAEVEEEYVEPVIEKFEPKEHLKYWLGDERARDQYALIKSNDVGIYWNSRSDLPELVQLRQNWSESFVTWSPKGSYFVSTHQQGLALWGGPSWKQVVRFLHPNVEHVDFSPNETYAVTFSKKPFLTREGLMHNLCVWEVLSGTLLRSFASSEVNDIFVWPYLQWSHDDKYVAKMKTGPQGCISVYEAETMGLLDKKSIKIENLLGFCWSPSDNYITYWTPELGNIPARVTLLNIPNRHIIRTKNFFNVLDVYWQQSGDYFLVKLERTKTKTTTITSFEVFRMREKDIPVDVVELKVSEVIDDVFWEPNGNRFAILLHMEQSHYVQFYEVEKSNKTGVSIASVKMLKQIDEKGISKVVWSPNGRICVLGGVKTSGDLMFWDVQDLVLLANGEHYGCTGIEWDPTGRYVASTVTSWKFKNDTGLILWSLAGQELTKQNINSLKQFCWRPRPKSLLSAEAQRKIKKNLKKYSKEFDQEDAIESNKASVDVKSRRKNQLAEYRQMMEEFAEKQLQEVEDRVKIYGCDPLTEEIEEIEEIIEVITEEIEEVDEIEA